MASNIRQLRRDTVLEGIVDHFLEHGLGNVSLRALAAAVGTSDRMLLYYFSNKDELMLEVFSRVVERQADRLHGTYHIRQAEQTVGQHPVHLCGHVVDTIGLLQQDCIQSQL